MGLNNTNGEKDYYENIKEEDNHYNELSQKMIILLQDNEDEYKKLSKNKPIVLKEYETHPFHSLVMKLCLGYFSDDKNEKQYFGLYPSYNEQYREDNLNPDQKHDSVAKLFEGFSKERKASYYMKHTLKKYFSINTVEELEKIIQEAIDKIKLNESVQGNKSELINNLSE